jgi:3,4-dihydroxy-2-butanone 4-phosphate synthase
VTTGISASDRAKTIHVAINPATVPGSAPSGTREPGAACPGGVLQRVDIPKPPSTSLGLPVYIPQV